MDNQPINNEQEHENDVSLAPLAKDGDKLMKALEDGHMAALLSKNEILYAYIDRRFWSYQCYIHPLGAEEGRCKSFDINEKNRAMIKNLATLADQIFDVTFGENMHYLGVMVAAEQGIIEFLDMTGNLPVDDFDFMTGETISN